MEEERTNQVLQRDGLFVIIGHTRFTTNGATNLHNAHPMEIKQLIGAHNGVIPNLAAKNDEQETNSDTRNLYNIIANEGLKEAVDRAHGSLALTFLDKSQRTFNMYRNWARDLYYVKNPLGTKYYWASEKGMLELMLERERLDHWADPVLIPEYELMTWRIGGSDFTTTEIKKTYRFSSTPVWSGSALIQPKKKNGFWDEMDCGYCNGCWREEYECECPPPKDYDDNRDNYSRRNVYCTKCWEVEAECLCDPWDQPATPVSSVLDERKYKWFGNQISPAYIIEPLLKEGCFCCKKQFRLEDLVLWPHWDYYLCKGCASGEFYSVALKEIPVYEGELLHSRSIGKENNHGC
jgi:hypothetical protein